MFITDPITANGAGPICDLEVSEGSVLVLEEAKSENHRGWEGRILADVLRHRGNIYGDVCMSSLNIWRIEEGLRDFSDTPSPPSGDRTLQ